MHTHTHNAMATVVGWVEILLDWKAAACLEVELVHLVVGVWQNVVLVEDLGSPGSAPGDII